MQKPAANTKEERHKTREKAKTDEIWIWRVTKSNPSRIAKKIKEEHENLNVQVGH